MDGEKGGRGYGGGGRGRLYTYRYTVTTRMTSALRWAATRATLIVRDKVTNKTVSTDHNFCREWTAEADSNSGPSAYQPDALPLDQTGSPKTGPLDWPEHEACRRRLIQYSTNRSRVGRSRRENRLSKRPV